MSWFLAITLPRKEFAVEASLSQLQINHYLFKHKITVVNRGRVIPKIAPAFGRYVFVEMAEDWMWRVVREITGVMMFACNRLTQQPWPVHPAVLKRCILALNEDGLLPYFPPAKFRFGDRVWVSGITSIVSGHSGVYQFPIHQDRSCVLMDWLGRMVPVEIDDRDLEKYESRYNRRRRRRGGRNGRDYGRREGSTTYQPRTEHAAAVPL